MISLRGTWYISPTPFTEGGAVDAESLTRLVAAAARWGADGITILGVMGEAADLTAAERDLVLNTVAEAASGTSKSGGGESAGFPFAVGCSAPSAAVVA